MRVLRLPQWLTGWLARRCDRVRAGRSADRVVRDGTGAAYLRRWYLYRGAGVFRPTGEGAAAYLHAFHASDGPKLHDHPWPSVSVILRGWYIEEVPIDARVPGGGTRRRVRRPGDVTLRRAASAHRIELPARADRPVVSLFLVGRRRRAWGFWCDRGWRDGPTVKRRQRAGGHPGAGCE